MKVVLDKFGRVLLPKALRERLGLRAGVELEVEERADGLVLRPRTEEPVRERDGLLVYDAAPEGDVAGHLERSRAERARRLGGASSEA